MELSRYKLGELIEQCDVRNDELKYTLEDVKGISIQKIFIETKADMKDVSLTPYKLVRPNNFAYVTVTSRNGEKITLAHNTTVNTYIVSSSYIVFKVNRTDLLSSDFLFIYFNRPEFDRYSRFNSWGSARETFSWEDMCDMDIDLPSLAIQQKYVNVYNAMVSNQKAYERGLEDLKLTCDAYIEDLRRRIPCESIGPYIDSVNENNSENAYTHVQGVESGGSFIDTRANMQGVDIGKYTVVRKGNIAYNPSRINIGSIALYNSDEPCVVSPMYSVFKVTDTDKVSPEYLMLWFNRTEFQRYTWYYAAGSVRDTFDFNLMQEVEFPIPSIETQKDIVNILTAYNKRKAINEKLKAQIKDICPILIKGSIEEGRNTKEA
ncbi:restriction endonuclease subunit S [Gardnerella piotii]|uniref:restriction endonuclease subunit S n=1 Tax=Gardnerella piotii TaxID=2792977 RepID=UPI00200C0DF7|nr:restriction endonuclease subunit S [Gardnerella piotii]UQA80524.1 restriction endonuclease subunit S [Gardnerella piotii]